MPDCCRIDSPEEKRRERLEALGKDLLDFKEVFKKLVAEMNLKKEICELLQIIKTDFSDSSVEFIFELINAHEWGIALETIYDLLSDNGILISEHSYNIIQELAIMMKMNTRNWNSLKTKTLRK